MCDIDGPRKEPPAGTHKPQVERVRPGDHVLVIYEDTAELTAFTVPFIKEGLSRGERCLYVADDLTLDEVTAAFASGGLDVPQEMKRGALVLVAAEEYATPAAFDAGRMIEGIRKRTVQTRSGRFSGVRIAAEMTWTCRLPPYDGALMEFESLLDMEAGANGVTGASLYRRDRFRPAVLKDLIRSHLNVIGQDRMFLELNPWFEGLARAELDALLRAARERFAVRGALFYQQGEEAADVFLLTRGRAQYGRTEPDGRRLMEIEIVTPPDLFGYGAALSATPRIASLVAVEDSRALVWDVATLRRVMRAHPEIAMVAIHELVQRNNERLEGVYLLATESVEQRLARVLQRLGVLTGRRTANGAVIELSLSGQGLAEMVMTTPFTISRILAGWRRLGIVDSRRHRTFILDAKRLAAIAGAGGGADAPAT